MASGPAPKAPEQRRRMNVPAAGEWVDLPVDGRQGRTPPWPLGTASDAEFGLWQRLWGTPQAVMWESMGVGTELEVARYVMLSMETTKLEELGAEKIKGVFAEVRQTAAGLGLGPKGLQDRRWRVLGDAAAAEVPLGPSAKVTDIASRRKRLTG